jgi:hypothetical protein
VVLQAGLLNKCLVAYTADLPPIVHMYHNVGLQVFLPFKGFLAELALVWPNGGVFHLMTSEL